MALKEYNKEVAQILVDYMELYPQCKLTNKGIALYIKALSPLSVEQIKNGMEYSVRHSKFFPTVAEIFEYSGYYSPKLAN